MVSFSMKCRRFQSSRAGFWRDRFVQIAREIDASASDAASVAHLARLRIRAAAGPVARVRTRASGLATA
jgi:hypothetical protein